MQLSPRTMAVLKNFSNMNPGIIINPGKQLRTIAKDSKDMFAVADIEDEFSKKFALSDLNKFLGILSSYENPTLSTKGADKYMVITEGKRKTNITYGEESFVIPPPSDIKMPPSIAEFHLSQAHKNTILKSAAILGLPEIAIIGDKARIFLKCMDSKNNTADMDVIEIGECINEFIVSFNTNNFSLLMDGEYDVTIAYDATKDRGVTQFKGKDITYWMAPLAKFSHYSK